MRNMSMYCCVDHFRPKFLIEGVVLEESFLVPGKLDGMPFHTVSKYWKSISLF